MPQPVQDALGLREALANPEVAERFFANAAAGAAIAGAGAGAGATGGGGGLLASCFADLLQRTS